MDISLGVNILITFIAQQLGGALLFFPITWLVMNKISEQKVKVGNSWLLIGFIATGIGAAGVRFVAMFVIGEKAARNPHGNYGMFFFLLLPILVAIGVCIFLRVKTPPAIKRPKEKDPAKIALMNQIAEEGFMAFADGLMKSRNPYRYPNVEVENLELIDYWDRGYVLAENRKK